MSLRAALKLGALTPACLGTGVRMLMLMDAIYSRRRSGPLLAVSDLDCGGPRDADEEGGSEVG